MMAKIIKREMIPNGMLILMKTYKVTEVAMLKKWAWNFLSKELPIYIHTEDREAS